MESTTPNNHTVKILIIDDEQLDLFISKKLLGLEFSVEGFTTVDEAMMWIQNNPYDVVLIDYYLGPNVYAHQVLEKIKSLKGLPPRAFVLSNFVDDEQTKELLDAGFHEIISKPLTLEKFKTLINL